MLERRYVLCEQGRHAVQARELCGDHDMRLSWVESADENNALLAALGKAMGVEPTSTPSDGEGVQVYLGGSDAEDEGHWSWVANGDSVMSPFAGEYSFTSPSLFAIRINISPRTGSVIISDDDADLVHAACPGRVGCGRTGRSPARVGILP